MLTDETTSPERQREADDIAAAALGIDFGEGDALREAVDLDVSASAFGPFDRPQLGGWLARPDDFDALVWWRFDRAIRSMAHMHELAKWAREHRKMLVFAEGIGGGRLLGDNDQSSTGSETGRQMLHLVRPGGVAADRQTLPLLTHAATGKPSDVAAGAFVCPQTSVRSAAAGRPADGAMTVEGCFLIAHRKIRRKPNRPSNRHL